MDRSTYHYLIGKGLGSKLRVYWLKTTYLIFEIVKSSIGEEDISSLQLEALRFPSSAPFLQEPFTYYVHIANILTCSSGHVETLNSRSVTVVQLFPLQTAGVGYATSSEIRVCLGMPDHILHHHL